MKYKNSLAALMLSAALISAPALSSTVYAHDGSSKCAHKMHCKHEHLSQSQRDLLHTTLDNLHEEDKLVFEDMHKLSHQKHDMLAAKTFDKDGFLSLTKQMEEKRDQLSKNHAEAFASIADKFSPEEREHIAHMFGSHKHHHGHRHGHGHHGGWMHGHERHHDWKQGSDSTKSSSNMTQAPTDNSQQDPAPPPAQ